MIANRSAMFTRPQQHISLQSRPYERRCVLVMPATEAEKYGAGAVVPTTEGGKYYTRARVVAAVALGEMRWVDKFHNAATFTVVAAGTWQKTRSGPVATMQMCVGLKGRYVPVSQREPELVLA